jgi:hypothetical protein
MPCLPAHRNIRHHLEQQIVICHQWVLVWDTSLLDWAEKRAQVVRTRCLMVN